MQPNTIYMPFIMCAIVAYDEGGIMAIKIKYNEIKPITNGQEPLFGIIEHLSKQPIGSHLSPGKHIVASQDIYLCDYIFKIAKNLFEVVPKNIRELGHGSYGNVQDSAISLFF